MTLALILALLVPAGLLFLVITINRLRRSDGVRQPDDRSGVVWVGSDNGSASIYREDTNWTSGAVDSRDSGSGGSWDSGGSGCDSGNSSGDSGGGDSGGGEGCD